MSTKTDNIAKLKALRVYGKWKANVLRHRRRGGIDRLLSTYADFEDLILTSFVFLNTPEGASFWEDISKK